MNRTFATGLITASLLAATAGAQMRDNTQPTMTCDDDHSQSDSIRHCEMREQTIAYPGQLTIDGRQNGGVSVKGWSRNDVLVRMKVTAQGATDSEAASLASQVHVSTSAGQIAADGPSTSDNRSWSVSYEVFAPHQANLQIKTHNGGVHLADLNGNIQFTAVNGGVHLQRLAGNVHGQTTNGGVHVELAGTRWDGTGMDVTTTNGGVHIEMPSTYSAHLDTSTANGSLHVDGVTLPTTAENGRHERPRQVSTDIGGGGATLHIVTTNGGVHVSRS